MSLVSRGLQIRRTLRNAGRMRTIVSVFAKHGFAELAERLGLGRFILEKWMPDEASAHRSVPERIRISFEELGPTFVKLGQLLASRPDLVPEEWSNEFARLHDRVQPLPFDQIDRVLREDLGEDYRSAFHSIDEEPLGSASIAQVHAAVLHDGRRVVLKVQRPGIAAKIKDDVNVLFFLADVVETYIPESKAFRPQDIVQEFFEALSIETNFIAEANNIRRFQENFRDEPKIKIPTVEMSLVTERVLCMERLDGVPLSSDRALEQGADRQDILRTGLRTYLKMVFMDGLFHGDLHAGNFLIYPDNRIGLIDFGQVGRLNSKTQSSIANMMLALSREDYERLAAEYLDLAPYSETADADALARDLRNLVAPYFGMTLRNVKLGQILMSSAGIAGAHQVSVPAELMLFFKSLIGIEGLGRRIDPDFDILSHALEFAGELVRHQYDPAKLTYELAQLTKDSKSLIASLPRQMHHWIRKVNSPGYASRIRIEEAEDLRKTFETSFHLIFLGLVIAALLLSSSVLAVFPAQQLILGLPALAVIGYTVALGLGIVAFFNYIRKA